MKNYSSIKDPKDIVTKEYVDNNSTGKKSSGVNAEIFNDYANGNAIGDYSSAHGKSTTNFNDITAPEAIYYKTLPGAEAHPHIVYYPFPEFYGFEHLYYVEKVCVKVLDKNKIPDGSQFVINFFDYASDSALKDYIPLVNGQCEINLSYYRGENTDIIDGHIEDPSGNIVNESYRLYDKYILPSKYNFEECLFTTNSSGATKVDKIYKYKDKWGNICYTLYPNWYPNNGELYEVNDWVYDRELVGNYDDIFVTDGKKYKLVFTEDFINSPSYNKIMNDDITIIEERDFSSNWYGTSLSNAPNVTINPDGSIEFGSYTEEEGIPGWGCSYFTDGYDWEYEGVIGTLYKYVGKTPTLLIEDNNPILKTIRYEALANNGQKFSLADGKASVVFGLDSVTNGDGAFAAGNQAQALAPYSTAFGKNALTRSENSMAIGTNKLEQNAVLMVGNGKSPSERSNALVSYRDGRLEIGADPINGMDVVTKKYLDSIVGDINTTLLNIIAQQEAIIAKQNELLGGNA